MTRPQTIATSYQSYSDPDFIALGQNILTGTRTNPSYPDPPQKPEELAKLLDQLADAVQTMKTGLKAATQQRDYLRAQAETAFKALSAYAAGATPARPDLWAAANFPLTKADTTPRAASQLVTGLAVLDGPSPRTLSAAVDNQPGMYAYAWRIYLRNTPADALADGYCYHFCLTREPKVLIENLDSGVAYGIECAAWNDTSPLQWSAPVYRIVQ